jgi:geranylgeranyl diphosphate synthase type I
MPDSSASVTSAAERVAAISARYRDAVLTGMREALEVPGVEHTRYMRYHLGWEEEDRGVGGKMLRPALCLLCCEAAGGNPAGAMPAAVALELLHNFTLIHDDIEDRSESRHGRETLWRRVGIAQAINAGDGMYTLARRTLLEMERAGVPASDVLRAARLLDNACIALCEGQYLDLSFESRETVSLDEYLAMVGGKSASLIAAACSIGALAAGADSYRVQDYGDFGWDLGLAFQIQDDVLGVWGDPAQTGKSKADDIRARKKSYPVVYSFDHLTGVERDELVRRYAAAPETDDTERIVDLLNGAGAREAAIETAGKHASQAIGALSVLELSEEREKDLEAIARFAVSRDR